jgi:hypothetical protein
MTAERRWGVFRSGAFNCNAKEVCTLEVLQGHCKCEQQ